MPETTTTTIALPRVSFLIRLPGTPNSSSVTGPTGSRPLFTWNALNADKVFIDQGIGLVKNSGSLEDLAGAVEDTTTWTITAVNSAGQSTATVTFDLETTYILVASMNYADEGTKVTFDLTQKGIAVDYGASGRVFRIKYSGTGITGQDFEFNPEDVDLLEETVTLTGLGQLQLPWRFQQTIQKDFATEGIEILRADIYTWLVGEEPNTNTVISTTVEIRDTSASTGYALVSNVSQVNEGSIIGLTFSNTNPVNYGISGRYFKLVASGNGIAQGDFVAAPGDLDSLTETVLLTGTAGNILPINFYPVIRQDLTTEDLETVNFDVYTWLNGAVESNVSVASTYVRIVDTSNTGPYTTTTSTTIPPNPCGPYANITVVGSTTGQVWGNNPYTEDSDMATAAVHAGLLQPGQTGILQRYDADFYSSYSGSVRNSVRSLSFSSFCGHKIQLLTPLASYFRVSFYNNAGFGDEISGPPANVYYEYATVNATHVVINNGPNLAANDTGSFGIVSASTTWTLTPYNGSLAGEPITVGYVFSTTTSTTTLPPQITTTTTTTLGPPASTTTSTTTTTTTTTLIPGRTYLNPCDRFAMDVTSRNPYEVIYYTIESA